MTETPAAAFLLSSNCIDHDLCALHIHFLGQRWIGFRQHRNDRGEMDHCILVGNSCIHTGGIGDVTPDHVDASGVVFRKIAPGNLAVGLVVEIETAHGVAA
jgi:hypothetical protein